MSEKEVLENRVERLEERVRYLEEQIQLKNAVARPQQPVIHSKPSQQKGIEWDVLIFQKILPPMFILVFIVGVIWGFKAVSDYGLLNERVKISLGFVVGFALIGLGIWQVKQSRKSLGHMLLGGAIPILMLTTFAMHQLYSMTGPFLSFVLNVIWIALGMFLTYKYKSQGIGIVATVGGVFVPFLIKSTSPNIPLFSIYEAMLFTLFLWIALRYSYKVLYFISIIFLQIAILAFFVFTQVAEEYKWIAMLPVFIQHGALLISFLKTKWMIPKQAYTLFSVMILTAIWIRMVFTESEASLLMMILATIYGAGVYIYRKDPIRVPIMIANGSLALLNLMQLQMNDLFVEGIIGLSIIYLLVYKKLHHILHAILCGITYFVACNYVFLNTAITWFSWEMFHWIVFIIATIYGIYLIAAINWQKKHFIFNIGVPYIGVLLLYFLHMIAILVSGEAGSNMERVFTSSFWIVVAILMMLLNNRFSLQQGKYVGVGILFFTLAKIILFDIPFVSVPIKALLFIVLGIVGLFVSRIYYKKMDDGEKSN
ncbi:DUF2339 domain-containing protein [Bacillus sp. FJAT-22090]|uniref:DUF2339 domain-containing protein n=1 Tax=Bacillus sp. FJAT-22090 TaxID=1581038 RepID=UPI00119DF407|nr:DUF2339 domain-containing protein [Bacillus sp. FJAT-22090]